ncbi:MAG: hydrolase 1, exosortase A system-associated [Sphingosinicella sp.]
MRELLTFDCEGAALAASLDRADGETGLLLVTGGTQTRIGSHRMYERLAAGLATRGIPCLRFDRRGVGDSEGEDPGFRGSRPDINCAAAAMRHHCASIRQLIGFGLCDGATALALYGDQAELDGLILVNPWLVEAESGEPPPAAVREHYRRRLLSREGWKKLFSGGVAYGKLLRGVSKVFRRHRPSPLAQNFAQAMQRHRLPVQLILATGDATAIAADRELKGLGLNGLRRQAQRIDSDSHTFAREGDDLHLAEAVLEAIRRLGGQAS